MQSSPHFTDVLVVGGGVIGLPAAWRLAREGASVRVIDASGTRGATWASAGMLAPVSESFFGEEDLLRLNLVALSRFPSFAAELEAAVEQLVGLRREGTLVVALDNGDRAALTRLSAFRASLGFATEELIGSAARRLEPYLSTEVRAAVLAPGDRSVDNRRYAMALHAGVARAGVEVVERRVVELVVDGGRARGARTDDGSEWRADTVVLAAGAWSRDLPGLPAAGAPPVRPVKGQILRLGLPPAMRSAGPVPFARCGVHGASCVVALTAQNTLGVTAIHECPPEFVVAQLEAVLSDIRPGAAKTGMLFSAPIIDAVVQTLAGRGLPLVVDPVMVASSGARLLQDDAVESLVTRLFPLATVVTPNLLEAQALTGLATEDRVALSEALVSLGARAALVTGGHGQRPVDHLYTDGRHLDIPVPRQAVAATHGAGCTHSAALAACLARGDDPSMAARRAASVATSAVATGLEEVGAGDGPVDVLDVRRMRPPEPAAEDAAGRSTLGDGPGGTAASSSTG
ncbi:MAG TPA: bifunctional hydroxymethylpyrimidine kinase/phosphomethylpyrimidine kinase [Actinomycetes bacterium]